MTSRTATRPCVVKARPHAAAWSGWRPWRRLPLTASDSPVRREKPRALSNAGLFLISRSEEHTSELQSRPHLVCRLLLEKKKKKKKGNRNTRKKMEETKRDKTSRRN